MISQYDVIKYLKNHESETGLIYKEDTKEIYDTSLGKIVFSLDDLYSVLKKKMHCDFESIFYDHVSLQNIIKCKECGTVIFSSEDEYEYDPLLRCPNCGGYHTNLKYWTAEDIEKDKDKQEAINFYIDLQKKRNESAERRKKKKWPLRF